VRRGIVGVADEHLDCFTGFRRHTKRIPTT
jgi:hypothetical protein